MHRLPGRHPHASAHPGANVGDITAADDQRTVEAGAERADSGPRVGGHGNETAFVRVPVCTENLSSAVVVMKSAQDGK
jgi:hypothetical protein